MSFLRPLLFGLVLLSTACAGTLTHGVPNLAEVDPGVWRSGQPQSFEAWEYLYSLGIRTVVKLNFESEGTDLGAIAAGMTVLYLPIQPVGDLASVFEAPDPAHIDAAVAAMARGGGVILHCSHGQDRTGIAVLAYRIRHDGWKKSRALREMLDLGFHVELPALDDFWMDEPPPRVLH